MAPIVFFGVHNPDNHKLARTSMNDCIVSPNMEPPSHAGLHEPQEWPSLKDSFIDVASSSYQSHHADDGYEDEGWDLLSPITPPYEKEVVVVDTSLRSMRGSASSPNLIRLCALAAVDEDDSFSLVSRAPSVLSAVSSLQSGFSFRDAVLSPTSTSSADECETTNITATPNSLPRSRNRPKLVVAPIKRCARSTGDLQSLVIHEEEVLGDSDAKEYYSQKSHGYVSRKNGMKQRPDELKRLQIVMYKKELQRSQQQQRAAGGDKTKK